MARDHLLCDKTEIVVTVLMGNQWRNVNITADKIKRIQFDKCKERVFLFKTVDSEKITIEYSPSEIPIVIYKQKEKKFFDDYKTRLEKFAKNNILTFIDNTKE
ncbi:MAG: hypothetical protein GX257_07105 [Clostridiales bacterium]|jgi:hypothetical protein|nr:hypothetical protein [Clostridiales bacterium]